MLNRLGEGSTFIPFPLSSLIRSAILPNEPASGPETCLDVEGRVVLIVNTEEEVAGNGGPTYPFAPLPFANDPAVLVEPGLPFFSTSLSLSFSLIALAFPKNAS